MNGAARKRLEFQRFVESMRGISQSVAAKFTRAHAVGYNGLERRLTTWEPPMIAPLDPQSLSALAAAAAEQGIVRLAADAGVSLPTVYRALRGETVQHTTRRALARAVARVARRITTTTTETRAA